MKKPRSSGMMPGWMRTIPGRSRGSKVKGKANLQRPLGRANESIRPVISQVYGSDDIAEKDGNGDQGDHLNESSAADEDRQLDDAEDEERDESVEVAPLQAEDLIFADGRPDYVERKEDREHRGGDRPEDDDELQRVEALHVLLDEVVAEEEEQDGAGVVRDVVQGRIDPAEDADRLLEEPIALNVEGLVEDADEAEGV